LATVICLEEQLGSLIYQLFYRMKFLQATGHSRHQHPFSNAFAERWVRTVREECLDYILILSSHHLTRVLSEFSTYYNASRPHQGIDQQTPILRQCHSDGIIHQKTILGGIINDYYRSPTLAALSSA